MHVSPYRLNRCNTALVFRVVSAITPLLRHCAAVEDRLRIFLRL